MRRTRTNPKTGIAYRKAGTALAVAVTFALYPAFARDAFAFKLFGMRLWGSEEPEVEVINPVKYAVTLNAPDADKSLTDSLENSSLLLADKDKPASGDLGLLIKARDDRDRLIAALYENARYGGIVNVTVAGRNVDDLPPNPVSTIARPFPWS